MEADHLEDHMTPYYQSGTVFSVGQQGKAQTWHVDVDAIDVSIDIILKVVELAAAEVPRILPVSQDRSRKITEFGRPLCGSFVFP